MLDMKQLTFANPRDWCTIAAAAERLDVSQRTIARMIGDGVLQAFMPIVGSRESSRHKTLLYMPEVLELRAARDRVKGNAHRDPEA